MVTVEKTVDKLQTENVSLHVASVLEKTVQAHALVDDICMQRHMKNAVAEKEQAVLLFAEEKVKRGNSALNKPLQKDVFTVTLKAGKQIGTLATSSEHVKNESVEV